MKIQRLYKPYNPHASFLLSPVMNDWLPKNHMIWFLIDLLSEMDLSAFERPILSRRGQPAYPPRLLLTLLLYGYCTGCTSSRKIECKTYEDVAFRIAAGNEHPDHDTLCRFRKRNLKAFQSLFTQVLQTACAMQLVSLGTVSLDGTKIKANASKHKAMSYQRMQTKEEELQETVRHLLKEAEQTDQEETKRYGKGSNLHTLPEELAYQQKRLETIRQARQALEQEALQESLATTKEQNLHKENEEGDDSDKNEPNKETQKGSPNNSSEKSILTNPPSNPVEQESTKENESIESSSEENTETQKQNEEPFHHQQEEEDHNNKTKQDHQEQQDNQESHCKAVQTNLQSNSLPVVPPPTKQRNFTDPDSRILRDSSHKTFVQGYNAQILVEESHQMIVANNVTQQANDKKQVIPMMEELQNQLHQRPTLFLADAGYCSEDNLHYLQTQGIDAYVATGRIPHNESSSLSMTNTNQTKPKSKQKTRNTHHNKKTKPTPHVQAMKQKLQTPEGKRTYGRRKGMVEPVFGWIKSIKRIDQFRLRGLEAVQGEWSLIALSHNVDRMYRVGKALLSQSSWKEQFQMG
ncbi:MAG: transposase [Paludibacter sp.]|nr:transposase [Paludibacter sp.]